jgi:copper(I)-binding protein
MRRNLLQLLLAGTACWLSSTSSFASGLQALPSRPATAVERVASDKTYTVGQLVIEAPWTRATPGGAQVAGGYVKITNKGAEADRLIGGSLPAASAGEVHEMVMTDGVMRMRHLEKGLEIKPGQTVELTPGGYHLMFTGLREGLKEGPPVKGTLVFEKAGSVEVEFRVAPIGARSGDGASGGHMRH